MTAGHHRVGMLHHWVGMLVLGQVGTLLPGKAEGSTLPEVEGVHRLESSILGAADPSVHLQ